MTRGSSDWKNPKSVSKHLKSLKWRISCWHAWQREIDSWYNCFGKVGCGLGRRWRYGSKTFSLTRIEFILLIGENWPTFRRSKRYAVQGPLMYLQILSIYFLNILSKHTPMMLTQTMFLSNWVGLINIPLLNIAMCPRWFVDFRKEQASISQYICSGIPHFQSFGVLDGQ